LALALTLLTMAAPAHRAQTPQTNPTLQTPVFRASVDSVAVDVSVERAGLFIPDLTAKDFEVRDNGVVQKIVDLTRESIPIDVTLIVDTSGSVRGPLFASLTRAIDEVGRQLRPDDRAKVVTFNQRIVEHLAVSPTSGVRLTDGLVNTSGNTALFDAIATSIITEPQPNRRQMAIVFTDGQDNVSLLDDDAVVEVARRSEPAIFGVALAGGTTRRPLPAAHGELFRKLADVTGGRFTLLQSDQDLSASFAQAFEDFRTGYVLRYVLSGVPRRGWHSVTVTVKRPGNYEVRARRGYQG